MLWWKRVERRTQDETKETRLLSTVNYGPTVIYGRHDFCCFLHRKPGLTHRNTLMTTVNYGGAVIYGGA
ncbi:hypothetical protein HanPSC8_Chr02g0070681 [Helianthus annuus]|nr:hypothetical protein HanPSC8_Chr14g0630951 [Helianthus annuus]KAJ0952303.1 hypothetical protein HanPSC8_Chr02g0070681 [Helianthus annuus]